MYFLQIPSREFPFKTARPELSPLAYGFNLLYTEYCPPVLLRPDFCSLVATIDIISSRNANGGIPWGWQGELRG